MCRSIVQLRQAETPATEAEVRAAALQFVRKVSGYRVPSRRNAAAFDAAVDEIAAVTARLLADLGHPTVAAREPAISTDTGTDTAADASDRLSA